MSVHVRATSRSKLRAAWGALIGLLLWAAPAARAQSAAAEDQQLVLAADGAVKILIRGTGWVSVGQPALVAAGLSAGADPAALQLFADGVEQALTVTGNGDHQFTADEAIEFYGVGRDTAWTDVRTYWLVVGSTGARVAGQAPLAAEAPGPVSYPDTETVVGHSIYVAAVLNGDASNFFGAAVSTTPVTINVSAPNPDPSGIGAAVLSVGLQGVTAVAHAVDVALNGVALGTCMLGASASATCSYPATGLVAGANSVTLVAQSSTDYTATESISVSYAHLYAADGDSLTFTAAGGSRTDIGGFTTGDVRVVDVTDATHPIELITSITGSAGAFHAVVDVPADASTRALYAFTAAQVLAPVAVQADAPSGWSTPHDGELLIISHASFLSALAPFVAHRQAQGWSVQLVDLADVYDERGFGDKSADAVRDFIQAARTAWRVPPRFVLLVGDATFDPRNFLGLGDFDFAPTRLIDTSSMETASDDWFVDADLDGVPELAIGRWPVRTADQAAALVTKTLGYAAAPGRGGLFVSDVDDTNLDFTDASAQAAAELSKRMPVTLLPRSDPSVTEAALVTQLNAGPFLVNYMGHGSVEVWDDLLDDTAAAGLKNGYASIYVVMNCLNGFFQDLYTTSLAETLLEAPGGAVAVWASSTLADFDQQPLYDQEFLMGTGSKSLGEAAVAAKGAITDMDARRTWLLFGDPTLLGSPTSLATPDAGATDAAPSPDAGGKSDSGMWDGGTAGAGGQTAAGGGGGSAGGGGGSAGGGGGSAGQSGGVDAAADAGHAPAGGGGCDCSVGGHGAGPGGAAGMMLLGVLVAGARRRRPRRTWARHALMGLVLALGVTAGARAQAAYGFRMDITLDRTRVGNSGTPTTTLTNYPLLLDITSANLKTVANSGHVQNANGYDITFVGNDSTTCGGTAPCTFKYEIESYSATTGRVIAWIQIPALNTVSATSNQTITVKYGDATISSPTQNVNGTWETNFKSVWHMNQTSSPASDSTSTADNASFNGTPAPATATGLIGSGLATSGTTGTGYLDYRSTTFNWASTDTFTYEGWFKTTDSYGPLFSQRDNGAGNPVIEFALGYDGITTGAGKVNVLVRDDSGSGTYAEVTGSTAVNDGGWHHLAVTRTGGTIQVYVDGSSIGSATSSGASSSITTGASGNYQNIGREGYWVQTSYANTDEQYLAGNFDEFRISKTVRSGDWLITDYNTMKTPSSTYSLGSEVPTTCGDGIEVAGEACDDGNAVNGDGCSSSCTIESGFNCTGTMPSVCTTTCGDGIVAGSEQCDDHGTVNGDGCSSTCTVESGYHCSGSPSVCVVANFNYYKTITVDRTKVGTASGPTTLSNYPMLFSVIDASLMTVANGGRVQSANGYDIIFRGTDSTTCGGTNTCTFSHEVEKYDGTTGQLIAWVNIPVLNTQKSSANTSFDISFGNAAITTSTQRVPFTWDSNFTGVWHLSQSPSGTAPQMTDSTSNGNNGTSASATTATGEMGSGVATDGSTSYVSFNSGSSLNVGAGSNFTYSAWVKTTDTVGAIFSLRSSTSSNPVLDIMVGMDGATTNGNKFMALVRDDSNGGQGDTADTTTAFNDGNWHLMNVVRNGTTLQLYDNTTAVGTPTTITSSSITTDTRNLGREGRWVQDNYTTAANEYLAATFDELRASTTARSIDWITTDYNSQSSPSTFIAYTTGAPGELTTNSQTEVAIVSLLATDDCPGTLIAWQTAYEINALGFNVYRELNGQRMRLNADLVPAMGISRPGGYSYQFVDATSADPSRTYWVEEVRLSLDTDQYGPVAPVPGPECGAAAGPADPAFGASGSPTPVVDTRSPAEAGEAGGCALGGCAPTSPLVISLTILGATILLRNARRRRT